MLSRAELCEVIDDSIFVKILPCLSLKPNYLQIYSMALVVTCCFYVVFRQTRRSACGKTSQLSNQSTALGRHLNCLVTTSRRECLVENRANMALPNLKCLISRENLHQIGTLFFLHGDGYTAESSRKLLRSLLHREFEFDHLRVIYPQAPDIAYRVATGGEETGVWYERNTFSPTDWERMDSINYSCTLISQLINQEKSRGIPLQNIIVGGFDMGGIIAMHTAYR